VYICSENWEKPLYQPGIERWSAYKTLWIRHWKEFQNISPYRFEKIYGSLTEEKKDQVQKLIRCGKFQNGFQRHPCPECGIVLVVPSTCKSRLCLSCARKRLFGWSLNLSKIMSDTLTHTHVTFTMPGTIARLLFKLNYEPEQMMPMTAKIYKNYLVSSAGLKGKEYQPGILVTLHKSGNRLNYNPHVHLIGTREIIDTKTGEIIEMTFIPYKNIRFIWKKAFLNHLLTQGTFTEEKYQKFNDIYKNGFHVYFQHITGNLNDVLFRTAEYIASEYFYNRQIVEVNHHIKTVAFRYKKRMDRGTRKKHYAIETISIYAFMARMLFFLPDKHRKMLRYYGIYAHNIRRKLDQIEKTPGQRY